MGEEVKLISVKCPQCGANLELDSEREKAYCQYCGAQLLIAKTVVNNNQYTENVNNSYSSTSFNSTVKHVHIKQAHSGIIGAIIDHIEYLKDKKDEEACRERALLVFEEEQRRKERKEKREEKREERRIQKEKNREISKKVIGFCVKHWEIFLSGIIGIVLSLHIFDLSALTRKIYGVGPEFKDNNIKVHIIVTIIFIVICFILFKLVSKKFNQYKKAESKKELFENDIKEMKEVFQTIFAFLKKYFGKHQDTENCNDEGEISENEKTSLY